MSIRRFPAFNRSRALGMFILLKALRVEIHQRYLACVALYGRPLMREFAWNQLTPSTKRTIATLRHATSS